MFESTSRLLGFIYLMINKPYLKYKHLQKYHPYYSFKVPNCKNIILPVVLANDCLYNDDDSGHHLM